jgi:hypothetical protein
LAKEIGERKGVENGAEGKGDVFVVGDSISMYTLDAVETLRL